MEDGATWESSPSSNESPTSTQPNPRFQAPSNYIHSTTNLPLMELDSTFQASQIPTTLGARSESEWNRRHHQNHISMLASSISFGGTEQQFQELLNQGGGSINFYPTPISYQFQHHHPIIPHQQQNMQENTVDQHEVEDSSSRPPMMNNWMSEGHQGIEHYGLNGSISRYQRNTIYDPMYETIGLPVDPHLRMFAARRGT